MRFVAFALLALSCGAPVPAGPPAPQPPIAQPAGGRLEYAHRIDDEDTWHRLAARPRNHVVARTEVVKFLIDLEDGRRIWFTDTERWDVHYHFARDRLGMGNTAADHEAFNIRQYRHPDRRFVMGSLVHYLDPDIWAFEMIAGDNLEGARVLEAFEHVKSAVFFGDRLRYRPMSTLHEEMIAPVADRIPRVSADDVFAGIRYQPLTEGTAFGTLRFVRGELDPASVRPDQILVLSELPDAIPVSSAVISAPLQAPLGHLAILCATRGTPNMALRNAHDEARVRALEGRLVRLDVGSQDFELRETTLAEAERAWGARRPTQPLVPVIDPNVTRLPDVCTLRIADAVSVGAKAAQLGEACGMGPPIHTPGGFAIPFAHYLTHIERSGIARAIPQMLGDQAFRTNAEVRGQRLAELRAAIEQASIDPNLIRQIRRRIAGFPNRPRVILRSSTNAEDLPGFTGAGLYRSLVIPGGATDAQIADALRQVWSSVWLQAAHEEREWYRVDHSRVAMGVLVQPFVDGAAVNGVAITGNPFYAGRPGYFINAQALGGSVTGAVGDEVPEQYVIYTYNETPEPELLSRSTRTNGAPLLAASEIIALTNVLTALHTHFGRAWQSRGIAPCGTTVDAQCMAVDAEYLIAGPDRHVVVLQARPFVVTYAEGQRWTD